MSRGLFHLPAELQVNIIEELVHQANVENGDWEGDGKNDGVRPNRDLINWSCASSFFRNLLAPYIFNRVTLHNTDKSGSSLLTLAQSRNWEIVRELRFVGIAPSDAHGEEKTCSYIDAIFPQSVRTLLSNLCIFPSLEKISIKFDYYISGFDDFLHRMDLGDEEESDEQVKVAEETFAWRALMAKTYDALLQNRSFQLKALEVEELLPKKVSTFSNPAFHTFLGTLERFSLSIHGEENGAEYMINRHPYYHTMMAKLDKFFFNHLQSVASLTLRAPEEGVIGLEDRLHVPLALRKGQMPLLKTLELEYILLCPVLVEFLLDHLDTLENIVLHNCSSHGDDAPSLSRYTHWSRLFSSLVHAKPRKLAQFSISPQEILLTADKCYDMGEQLARISQEVNEGNAILQADPRRRVFAHTYLDDIYGTLFSDEEANLRSFQRGEDQASFEKLMSIVDANAKKS